MGTNNKVHSRAFAAWVSLHRYGFMQVVFSILTALSLLWMYFYGEPYPYTERGFFSLMGGYVSAFIFPWVCMAFFFRDGVIQFMAFIHAVLCGYLLAITWCAYWGISYIFPIAAAGLLTIFYKEIRPNDKDTKNKTLFAAVIWIWFISGFALATVFSYLQYKDILKDKGYTQRALNMPTIKAIDCKDSYIYTEEYGLEKVYHYTTPIPAGSLIHRLPVDEEDGDVFIVAE